MNRREVDLRDTYFVLLGLPAGRRPPDYYTLLGLEPLESDPPQIHAAVERQLAKLTPLLLTAQGRKAQRLIGEVLQARDVLISRRRREEYNAKLAGAGLIKPEETPTRVESKDEAPTIVAPRAAELPEAPPLDVDALLPPPAYEPTGPIAPGPVATAPVSPGPALDSPTSPVVARTPAFVQTPQRVLARPEKDLSLSEMALDILQPLDSQPEEFSSPIAESAIDAILPPAAKPIPAVVPEALFSPYAEVVETRRPAPVSVSGDWLHAKSAPSPVPEKHDLSFGHSHDIVPTAPRSQEASKGIMLTVLAVIIGGAAVVVCGALAANYQHNARLAEISKTTPASQKGTASATPSKSQSKPPTKTSTSPKPRPMETARPATPVPSPTSATSNEPKPPAPKPVEPVKPADPAASSPSPEPKMIPPAAPDTKSDTKPDPKQVAAVRESLTAARAALGKRDLAAAGKELDLALIEASSVELVAEVEVVKTLHHYVDGFWGAVRDRIKGMKGGEELPIGKRVIIVVEVVGEKLIVRDSGANKTYGILDMPPALAAALAESWLKKDDPNSAIFVGAFWAVDARGDAKRGRQILEDAKKAGAEAATGVLDALGPAK